MTAQKDEQIAQVTAQKDEQIAHLKAQLAQLANLRRLDDAGVVGAERAALPPPAPTRAGTAQRLASDASEGHVSMEISTGTGGTTTTVHATSTPLVRDGLTAAAVLIVANDYPGLPKGATLPQVKAEADGYERIVTATGGHATVLRNATVEQFRSALGATRPDALIFCGHGDTQLGAELSLAFMNSDRGRIELERDDTIVGILCKHAEDCEDAAAAAGGREAGARLQMVVLNGCCTYRLADLLRKSAPPALRHILCWRSITHDGAARAFGEAYVKRRLRRRHQLRHEDASAAFGGAKYDVLLMRRDGQIGNGWVRTAQPKFAFVDPRDAARVDPASGRLRDGSGSLAAGVPALVDLRVEEKRAADARFVNELEPLLRDWATKEVPSRSLPRLEELRAHLDVLDVGLAEGGVDALAACEELAVTVVQLIRGAAGPFAATPESVARLAAIVLQGNKEYLQVYGSMLRKVRNNVDFAAFCEELSVVVVDESRYPQRVAKLAAVYAGAAQALPRFEQVLAEAVRRAHTGKMRVASLKRVFRVLQKQATRTDGGEPHECEMACDIVRGSIVCDSMRGLVTVLRVVLQMRDEGKVVVVRHKDRFRAPTAAGWADAMLNIVCLGPGLGGAAAAGHVCELQLVHARMLQARKELGGHSAYAAFREAAELLACAVAGGGGNGAKALASACKAGDRDTARVLLYAGVESVDIPGMGDIGKVTLSETMLSSDSSKLHGLRCDGWRLTPSTTNLDLQGKLSGVIDVNLVSSVLKVNNSLATLDLRDNKIGDEGGKAIAEVLPKCPLTSINLLQNKLRKNGARAILGACEKSSTLTTVLGLGGKDAADFSNKGWDVPHAILVAAELKVNNSLTSLDLRSNGIGVEGGKAIAKVLPSSSLTSINLLLNNIGDGAAAVIAAAEQNGKIKTLCGIKPGQAEADFRVWGLKPADAQLLAFDVKFSSPLISVNLLKNDLGNGLEALSAAFEESSTLKSLCGLRAGKDTADFRSQCLRAADARLFAVELQFNSPLKSANLGGNDIGDGGVIAISEALKTNSTLTELGLQSEWNSSNKIGPAGAQALADMLKVNSPLTSLNLYNNNIGDEGGKAIAEVLSKCPLKVLNLAANGIGNPGAAALAVVLPNGPLTSVNLLSNDIRGGAAAIIAAAEQNGQIKTLCGIKPDQTEADFSRWCLKPADAQLLAFDLKPSSPLKQLNLYRNKIGAEGAKALAAVLSTSLLTDINISGNKIGNGGKRAIGKALLSSSTSKLQFLTCDEWSIRTDTTELSLIGKGLGSADAQLMAGVIKFNSPLTTLNLQQNNIGVEGGKAIAEVLPKW
eukprot:g5239.t1